MGGSQKLPLLIIGKFERPRCMKNIKTLPVTYKANKKAWMTGKIFEEWLRKLDRKFLLRGRSIALIVDDCSDHPLLDGLRAVRLIFLPPIMLQPCDQGIIQNLKYLYRKRVLPRFIALFDDSGSDDAHYKLTVLDAINYAAASWEKVKQETIANCFRKAGFTKVNDGEVVTTTTTSSDGPSATAETKHLSLREIAAQSEKTPFELEEDEDEDIESGKEQAIVSNNEAESAISTLRLYRQQHETSSEDLTLLNNMERRLSKIMTTAKKAVRHQVFFKPIQKDSHQM
ncbi:tigger transposable element-derived protein 4 [Elysia marginata]|uniref:Tigger transposable element-derived protein 4 n=1 Tax=Elysia marginata TaxID=1093978 RepID=A0AAV4GPZ2_9GAST|nr:tigger transposable element-derived protein 4 [Elysia marginata]